LPKRKTEPSKLKASLFGYFSPSSAWPKEMQPKISKTSSQVIHRGTTFIKSFLCMR